jgi:WXG100 family type VII secretion target
MADLHVDTDEAFKTAQAIGNQAVELHDELENLTKKWDDMSHTWEGVAATAYQPVWDQWHENATKVVRALMESSEKLAQAAAAYEEQDAAGGQTVNTTMDIGL